MGDPLESWLAEMGPTQAFDTVTTLLPDVAVFVVDRERKVLHWSEGAARLLGFSAEETVGESCLKANRCFQCSTGCGIEANGKVTKQPLTLFRSDGESLRVHKTARAFFDHNNDFAGGIEVLRPMPPPATEDVLPPESLRNDRAVFFGDVATVDASMHEVIRTSRNVAETDTNVLVRGESGTGKELMARALHLHSARKDKPFVAVNCAALSATLIESELFGHVRGAFTGAISDRDGIFKRADGGTLFLDEVAEIPLELQSKLLRVLEERVFIPVGGTKPQRVDIRIISATHVALRDAVAAGRFREDLMFRLRVVPIYLPPLRERRADIQYLLWRFIGERNVAGPRVVDSVAPEAMRALLDHPWPGNVRELRNVVEYAFAVGRGREFPLEELPPEFREAAPPKPSTATPREFEAQHIERTLRDNGGNVGKAAEQLGMSRATLWRKRKKYGL